MIELFPGIVFTWLAFWILYALLSHMVYPLVRMLLRAMHPATASSALLAWITLPAVAALCSSLVLLWPLIETFTGDAYCQQGQCGALIRASELVGLPAAVIAIWLVVSGLTIFVRYWLPAHRLIQNLHYACSDNGRFSILHSPTAAAFTLGWLRPRIFLSEGLLAQCNEEDIRCILHHEQAHQRRKDNLCQLMARLFTVVMPQRIVALQLDDYSLFCEKACDLEAARHQPADQVAGTLLKVAKLQGHLSPYAVTTFLGGHLEERILSVLQLEDDKSIWQQLLLYFVVAGAFLAIPLTLFAQLLPW